MVLGIVVVVVVGGGWVVYLWCGVGVVVVVWIGIFGFGGRFDCCVDCFFCGVVGGCFVYVGECVYVFIGCVFCDGVDMFCYV